MKILTIDGIMQHCRIDNTEEAEYIATLGESAEGIVETYLNRTFEEWVNTDGAVPQAIVHACYLVVADLYRNREASSQVQLYGNPALMALLRPYKRLI